jgi:hypothetical protein
VQVKGVVLIFLNSSQTSHPPVPKTIRRVRCAPAQKQKRAMNNPRRKLCQANNSTRKAPQREILSKERRIVSKTTQS